MRRRHFSRLELIAFLTGFVLMAFELTASRILAPAIGSSTYVWTSVIGVIIAALSVGYYTGGKLADTRDNALDVAALCFIAAVAVVLSLFLYEPVLQLIAVTVEDARLQGVVAATVLFAPTSFILGTISPYLAKLNVRSLATSGRSVASLSALNSVGGIAGTFVTGFILFGYLGSVETLKVVIVLLALTSWLVVPHRRVLERTIFTVALAGLLIAPATSNVAMAKNIDTPSAHYKIVGGGYEGRQVTGLITGPGGIQSAVYQDGDDELVFWYTRELARVIVPRAPQRILVLGGGAFTLPQYLARELPSSQIDVVEIDPALESIAEEYFYYDNPQNVKLIFNDARAYVNQNKEPYDVVVVDTYGDSQIPFALTTREYVASLARQVKPDGLVLANIVAGTAGGACERVFSAVDGAYKTEFPYAVYSQQANLPRVNNVVAYSRDKLTVEGMKPLELPRGIELTDNFAPTERLYFDCQKV